MNADGFAVSLEPRDRPPRRCRAVAVALLALGLGWTVAADCALYKWTDANGRVVYSDQPPAGNVKYEEINASSPSPNPQAVREMATKEVEFQKRQTERAKQEQQAAKDRAAAEQKVAACARANAQAKELGAGSIPMYRLNEKGERVLMDQAARTKEQQRLEQWVRENCGR